MPRYTSLSELKDYVGIDNTNSDSILTSSIDAAETYIDEFTRRTFDTVDTTDDSQKESKVYTADGPTLVTIDDAEKIDSVEERYSLSGSWSTVDADHYVEEQEDGRPITMIRRVVGTFPKGLHLVRVTGWFGWDATPEAVKHAALLHASFVYQRRQAPLGISQIPGLEGNTGMRVRSKLDPTAETLVRTFRRPAGVSLA